MEGGTCEGNWRASRRNKRNWGIQEGKGVGLNGSNKDMAPCEIVLV